MFRTSLPIPDGFATWQAWARVLISNLVSSAADKRIFLHAVSRAAATFDSATWTAFHNSGAAFVDTLERGISLTNSTLTFVKGGVYRVCLTLHEELLLGKQETGLRLMLGSTPVLAQMNGLGGLVQVLDGTELVLEYAMNGGHNSSWTPLTLDGTDMDMCVLTVLEVGDLSF